MAKLKEGGIPLPEGIQIARSRGKTNYYYVPNRNTSYAGKRIALGRDPTDPQFWERLRKAKVR